MLVVAHAQTKPIRRHIILIALLCFTVNLFVGTYIGLNKPSHFSDYRAEWNSDGNNYVRLGENFWLRHVYSRQPEPPYQPDVKWTPVYPILAGGINLLFNAIWPLYAVQILFSVGTALLTYAIASSKFGTGVGLIAGVICAVDLTLLTLNFEVMSEPLYVFLSTAALLLWVRLLYAIKNEPSIVLHAFVGFVLGIAILTRPTGLYLPFLLAIIEFLLFRRRGRHYVVGCVVLIAVAVATVLPWGLRNYIVVGVPRLTVVDGTNLAYYVAASVYQVEYGIDDFEVAQARVASDYSLVSATEAHNPWLTSRDIATMDKEWRNAAWEIFRQYPRSLAAAAVRGVTIGLFAHTVSDLANASKMAWNNPGLHRLQKLELTGFLRGLLSNHTFLVFVFVWEELLMIAAIGMAIIGIVTGLSSRLSRCGTLALLVVLMYYLCTMALQGLTPDARIRTPLMPLIYVFAALGAHRIFSRIPHKRPLINKSRNVRDALDMNEY